MTKKKECEPRVCLECGEPIPETRHYKSVTCSDACQHKRSDRQRNGDLRRRGADVKYKRRRGEPSSHGSRLCAGGCGRWINDYRCPECWAKLRAKEGLPVHDGDGGFEEHTTWR